MLIKKKICESLSDNEIISKSKKDVDYFSCLYLRYENKLKRYISKISDFDAETTEDILQNAFINVWKNINSIDDSLKLSSLLYRVVHNETVSQWRKKSSTDEVKKVYEINHHNDIDDLDEVENIEKTIEINKILDQMSMKYKEVLVLKFMENMDYEEISNILKIPEGTVATRINRAKKSFIKISEKDNLTHELLK